MKIYAVYRILYGEDFVEESILSIADYVDKIFVFYDTRPWGQIMEVEYMGDKIVIPEKIDNVMDKIKGMNHSKIEILFARYETNKNIVTNYVNDIILPNYDAPDVIWFIEPDHVIHEKTGPKILDSIKQNEINQKYNCMFTKQHEIWRGFRHEVYPERKRRLSTVIWHLNSLRDKKMPETGRHADAKNKKIDTTFLEHKIHNYGFAVSEKTMYWKHIITIGFSRYIGDAMPNISWYNEKWLKWDYKTNNDCLEISKGRECNIKTTVPYDINGHPSLMKNFTRE